MNLQDRIKQIGGITSKQTSVLNHNDYTPQTYYSGIDSKVMYIDTLDALIETIMEYYIHTMLICNNKINEVSYLTNKRIDKQVQLTLDKIFGDLEQLKNNDSGYYKYQSGRTITVEYYYPPISETPVIFIVNNKIEMYNMTAFNNLKSVLDEGKNAILCGNVDFSSISSLLETHFAQSNLVVVNGQLIAPSTALHFNPVKKYEEAVYNTILRRTTEDEYIIVNNPKDMESLTELFINKSRVLVFLPKNSAQEVVSQIQRELNTEFLKVSFTDKLGGIFVLKKEGTEIKCSVKQMATPLSSKGRKALNSLKIENLNNDKLYLI